MSFIIELCRILSNNNKSLSDDVQLCIEYPRQYLEKYEQELKLRGITTVSNDLRWIAVVDGLIRLKKLEEIDWKERGESLLQTVVRLAVAKNLPTKVMNELSTFNLDNYESTNFTLNRLDSILQSNNFTLIMIDIDADCYPLTIIGFSDFRALTIPNNQIENGRIKNFFTF